MKFVWMLCLGTVLALAADPAREIAEQVPKARAILDGWQAKDPVAGERKLQVVYWTPADVEPSPRYRERLSAILKDIRAFYAAQMERNGFGPRTIRLDLDQDDLVRMHLVRGAHPYANYDYKSGDAIRKEAATALKAEGISADQETVVIFCNMSSWDPDKKTTSQNGPYYASGNCFSGTAWQIDSPVLDLGLLEKKEPMIRDHQYRDISIGRYNSIFIGGIAHEMGHALGMPHNEERPDQKVLGTALMGSGNRTYGEDRRGEGKGSFLTLAHAFRLAAHPMFCGSLKGFGQPASARLTDMAVRQSGKGFVFSGKVTGDPPVYAVIGYLDPAGGDDYDATTTTAVPDRNGRFELDCQAVESNKPGELRVFLLQSNGAATGFLSGTPYRYSYHVGADGTADISAIQARFALAPLAAAIYRKDAQAAATALAALPQANPHLITVAKAAIASMHPVTVDPAAVPAATKEISLTAMNWSGARTGWGAPVRDRLPDDSVFLQAGGRMFAHGLYAHAPAFHEWELDGSWTSLRGEAGVADGHSGSVRFHIAADGKEIWKSKVIREGQTTRFDLKLEGVRKLTLTTDDGGDGNGSDWGVWLDPLLGR